eukprot:scaffold55439_cov23-Prasinocladus_malaysianus.AAC.1
MSSQPEKPVVALDLGQPREPVRPHNLSSNIQSAQKRQSSASNHGRDSGCDTSQRGTHSSEQQPTYNQQSQQFLERDCDSSLVAAESVDEQLRHSLMGLPQSSHNQHWNANPTNTNAFATHKYPAQPPSAAPSAFGQGFSCAGGPSYGQPTYHRPEFPQQTHCQGQFGHSRQDSWGFGGVLDPHRVDTQMPQPCNSPNGAYLKSNALYGTRTPYMLTPREPSLPGPGYNTGYSAFAQAQSAQFPHAPSSMPMYGSTQDAADDTNHMFKVLMANVTDLVQAIQTNQVSDDNGVQYLRQMVSHYPPLLKLKLPLPPFLTLPFHFVPFREPDHIKVRQWLQLPWTLARVANLRLGLAALRPSHASRGATLTDAVFERIINVAAAHPNHPNDHTQRLRVQRLLTVIPHAFNILQLLIIADCYAVLRIAVCD